MHINFDRICQLAGVKSQSKSKFLSESKEMEKEEGMHYEMNDDYMMEEEEEEKEEGMHYEMADDMQDEKKEEEEDEEMVEVDISELMSEIRRAKNIMKIQESKKRRRQSLQESKLKNIIAQEVESVLAEMQAKDFDGSWVYGSKKPRRSKKGYVAQGSFIPGIGFRK